MLDKDLYKLALKNGWHEVRVHGSHHIVEKDRKTVSIPIHSKDLKKGIERKLLKELGLLSLFLIQVEK